MFLEDARQKFFSIVDKGKSVVRTSLQAALDLADLATRSMVSAVAMHRENQGRTAIPLFSFSSDFLGRAVTLAIGLCTNTLQGLLVGLIPAGAVL